MEFNMTGNDQWQVTLWHLTWNVVEKPSVTVWPKSCYFSYTTAGMENESKYISCILVIGYKSNVFAGNKFVGIFAVVLHV